jgi:hypothetical protein
MTVLSDHAKEEGAFTITASFTDEDDQAVTPNDGLVWHLTDKDGNVINSREDVALVEASSIDITLSGDDLAFQAAEAGLEKVLRILTLEGTYNSSKGSNLPLKDEVKFYVDALVYIPSE